ncbi:hypothetical protein [Vallitalea maricola]|uniref:Uncharacterized protein n=1 Tax=Vallitalea maricola TaxID=3074433 RepID=A0ACB5UPD0_9FIRM|nr:hypothetical protein AN2V17_35630 [Vallitalea sp. AN17-2]
MSESVSQKEFYEALAKVTKEIGDLTKEMTETKTLIRDYNGLRDKIDKFDNRLQSLENRNDNKKNYREYIAWLVALINTLLAIFMAIN